MVMLEQIQNFKTYLLIEKKYSHNTIESYERDLKKFLSFMTKELSQIQEQED